jgi:hypothetical protein
LRDPFLIVPCACHKEYNLSSRGERSMLSLSQSSDGWQTPNTSF